LRAANGNCYASNKDILRPLVSDQMQIQISSKMAVA
jgi:hypothetical protein